MSPRTDSAQVPGASAFNGVRRLPLPVNETVRKYCIGSDERKSLKNRIEAMANEQIEIPLIIGGQEHRTATQVQVVMPHDHRHVLARVSQAEPHHVTLAAEAACRAQREWSEWPWEERAGVFLKAAELLATNRRDTLNAATMLGQSKTVHQAEIDAACELIDFWRFNSWFAGSIYAEQPLSGAGVWNSMDYRGLEGFVYSVSPFNFTAIGGNLACAPAMMGCAVVWKPAASAALSNYYVMRVLEEAGLPPGVINFLPGDPITVSETLLGDAALAGVHFTGSTNVFNAIWQTIGANISHYHSYPRMVGETGGKDFIVAHMSADERALALAMVRGAFEYQGQKCSAASRAYVPKSMWPVLRDRLVSMIGDIAIGDPRDFRNLMGAVIDAKAFARIAGYVQDAKATATVIAGGGFDGDHGYFVQPTLIESPTADHRLLREEIFGPVLTVYVYDDKRWAEMLSLVDATSSYALTGAIFARDRLAIREAASTLRYSAGNFYINDKPTGAVVGQQPFGGARRSGTNDKAGSKVNLLRWTSPRSIKETLSPSTDAAYPSMAAE